MNDEASGQAETAPISSPSASGEGNLWPRMRLTCSDSSALQQIPCSVHAASVIAVDIAFVRTVDKVRCLVCTLNCLLIVIIATIAAKLVQTLSQPAENKSCSDYFNSLVDIPLETLEQVAFIECALFTQNLLKATPDASGQSYSC